MNCKELYLPDYRNLRHQKYCNKPECRRASKKASQQRYLNSEKGCDYFKGPLAVARVQHWRREHPGYWKHKVHSSENALQEDCLSQHDLNQSITEDLHHNALQDVCFLQPALIVGLISSLTGNALQDDIAETTRRFIHLGHDIIAGASMPSAPPERRSSG
ncbi:MAG: hypothetical protein HC880_17245 [Bacteroidia bacterium]|nr:hypothetical protein [Bacteroidia bacterium]